MDKATSPQTNEAEAPAADAFRAGEVGRLISTTDWSKTQLGPRETWPPPLKILLDTILGSRFPMLLWWGHDLLHFYNDAVLSILSDKHPRALGAPAEQVWREAWSVAGPMARSVLQGGAATWAEDLQLFISRAGIAEESYFTFSYSPAPAEAGVGGVLIAVQETTAKVRSERQIRMLHELTAGASSARCEEDAYRIAMRVLEQNDLDLPFALLYVVSETAGFARLAGASGWAGYDGPANLARMSVGSAAQRGAWPLAEVLASGEPVLVEDLAERFGSLPVGRWNGRPQRAMMIPLRRAAQSAPYAVLIGGISPHRPFDHWYRKFFLATAEQVAAAVEHARAYDQERKRAEDLTATDRAKTAFFSNVSHEFRTPLTLMLGPLEDALRADGLCEPQRERIETAYRNSLRLLKLVNVLLDFSRIEAGRADALYQPTDLAALTAELASHFQSAAKRVGLVLTVDCPALPEPVYVDRDMWEKIVLNLLSNAFKHTFQGGIGVRLRWRDGPQLTVEDSGVGIPQEEIPRLFERFHRVKGAAARTFEGSGIGLSLVWELVRAHAGQVRIESEPGKGSRFIVTLPAGAAHLPPERLGDGGSTTPRQAAAYAQEVLHWMPRAQTGASTADQRNPAAPTEASAMQGSPRPRILWADDNADMRRHVARLLEGSYEVIEVGDGEEAIEAARSAPPDLVLCDVMMPRLDGFGLLKALRADERTRGIPVILLSARAGEESAVEGIEVGADDYLIKPFSGRELLARVRTHLQLARQRREWQQQLERKVAERTAELAAMTEELRAENIRHQGTERRLQIAYDDLRRTQRTVLQQERLRALGQMASGIAHDINNAISPAALYVESLLESDPALSSRAREYLPVVLRAIGDVESTVDRMREFYRSREHEATLISVDLNELVEQAVELTRARWNDMPLKRGIVVNVVKELCPDLPSVLGIESEIRMALTNLIFNAVDAMPEGGTLTLSTSELPMDQVVDGEPRQRGICLEVIDTGIGMDEETSSKCLEPFFTTKGERGTGLGLAMVYGAAQRHGADIEIDSRPGEGTRIRLSFPAPLVARPAVPRPHLPAVAAKRLRVLIIDDDPLVLKSLSDTLEAEGHAAVIAADSRHGLDIFRCAQLTEPFSAVITDLGMPHLDGYGVAKAVKESSPMTPVILLTGWGRRLESDSDTPPNVDRVLAKPPKLRELRAALAECCAIKERGRASGQDTLDSTSFG